MIRWLANWWRSKKLDATTMFVNAYATRRDLPAITFPHLALARRDWRDPELPAHLRGFVGFVTDRGTRPLTTMRRAVLGHIDRVRHHIALEADVAHWPALSGWARDANAIMVWTDRTVRAPDGKVLVGAYVGDPEPGAEVPYPVDAVARKAITEAALDARGVNVSRSLSPVVSEIEVEMREPREVATQCLALFACALGTESLAAAESIPAGDLEPAFMAAAAPPRQGVIDDACRYEALAVLAWTVRAVDVLSFPDAIVDVPALARTMRGLDAEVFVSCAKLRPTSEILDALDVTFRLHWATVNARVKEKPPSAGLDPGAVKERYHALSWLTRFEGVHWEDVTTPTS